MLTRGYFHCRAIAIDTLIYAITPLLAAIIAAFDIRIISILLRHYFRHRFRR